MFEHYLKQWRLTPDGEPLVTHSSRLLPVRFDGKAAMLKVALEPEERRGGLLMRWWDGDGAARVFACDRNAILLERAQGSVSLRQMSDSSNDDEACRIICDCVARLHTIRSQPLPELATLREWFRDLKPGAEKYGDILKLSASTAADLLNRPQEITVLHGDIHHDNILDFGSCGWLAIDPKGLIGERGFDYANLFYNPEREIAADPGLFIRRIKIVSQTAGIEPERLLKWIIAWGGLSAVWFLDDGQRRSAELNFAVIQMASKQLALLR